MFIFFYEILTFAFDENDFIGDQNPDYVLDTQWWMEKIKLFDAWNVSQGSTDIRVGIIDSGIDITHPDLEGLVSESLSQSFLKSIDAGDIESENIIYDSINDEQIYEYQYPLFDRFGHGTSVAGIIGANCNNNYGIRSTCPNITLVSLKIVNEYGEWEYNNMIEAIEYAANHDIKILNISLSKHQYRSDLYDAIADFPDLVICTPGNDNINIDFSPRYPASFDLANILVVGASNQNDTIVSGTNFGLNSVDIFAPGIDIVAPFPKHLCDELPQSNDDITSCDATGTHIVDGFHSLKGTSYSAPQVTGIASLIYSMNETLTAQRVKEIILNNVDKITGFSNSCVSGGRLNAKKALNTFVHTHTLQYRYLNNTTHVMSCTCGYSTGETAGHAIYAEYANQLLAPCIGCATLLNLRTDIASIVMGINDALKVSNNGSYIRPDGIIIIVDEDIEAYLNNSLIFFNPNEERTCS